MQLEELSTSQIVLLTLLVSFVTSIATGIITVSLMEQAPPTIAQTVNRVVERTIEKVVSVPAQTAAAVVTEKTIVVKESDLITSALSSVESSIVRLYTKANDAEGKEYDLFLGLGVVASNGGLIVTDSATIPAHGQITVHRFDGTRADASLIAASASTSVARLQGATSTGEAPISWKPAVFTDTAPLLGASVVGISGKTSTRIGSGLITAIPPAIDGPVVVDTSVPSGAILFGSPLIDLDGKVVGISTAVSRAVSESAFLSSAPMVYNEPQAEASPSP